MMRRKPVLKPSDAFKEIRVRNILIWRIIEADLSNFGDSNGHTNQ